MTGIFIRRGGWDTDMQGGKTTGRLKWKLLNQVWLCDPMDCSLPGCSVHGILQARILEWVAVLFSRGSLQPTDGTQVSCTADSLPSEPLGFLGP